MSSEINIDGDDVILVINDKAREIVEVDSDSSPEEVNSVSSDDEDVQEEQTQSHEIISAESPSTDSIKEPSVNAITVTQSIIIPSELSRLIPAPDVTRNTELDVPVSSPLVIPPTFVSADELIIESIAEIPSKTTHENGNESIDTDMKDLTNTITNTTSLGLLANYGSDSESDLDAEEITLPISSNIETNDTREIAIKKLNNFIEEGSYRIVSDSSEESEDDEYFILHANH